MRCCFRGSKTEPACTRPAIGGARTCESHWAYFIELRQQLEAESRGRRATGKGRRGLVCCRRDCNNPRLRGEAFCDACQDAGYIEESE